jgi:hypothetical protein
VTATGARINVKVGHIKSAYAISDADLALWQEKEGEWGMRLEGRAVRTDSALSDTGALRVSGTFRRGGALRDAKVELRAALEKGQLGQLTKLVFGYDAGWRADVSATAELSGTLSELRVQAEAALADFRRYDVTSDQNVTLAASCAARYLAAEDMLAELDCASPSLRGIVLARGSLARIFGERAYQLSFAVQDVPVSSVVALAHNAGLALPHDLSVAGAWDAVLRVRGRRGERPEWSGEGMVRGAALQSAAFGPELRIGSAQFVVDQGDGTLRGAPDTEPPVRLLVAPFPVDMGAARPALGAARFTASGYSLELHGDVEVARVLTLARAFGLRPPELRAQGSATVALDLAGGWRSADPPSATGKAALRQVTIGFGGLAAPLQVTSGAVQITPRQVSLEKLSVSVPQTALKLSGSLRVPRCGDMAKCPAEFRFSAGTVSSAELNKLLHSAPSRWPWLRFGRDLETPAFPLRAVHARGHITAERAEIGAVTGQRVSAELSLAAGVLTAARLRGEVFGGRHSGAWRVDFTGDQPVFSGSGRLERVSAARMAESMADDWAAGTLELDYSLALSGRSAVQFRATASGSLQFRWDDAVLKHVVLPGRTGPLVAERFSGRLRLGRGAFTFLETRLQTSAGDFALSGTASLERRLDLRLLSTERAGLRPAAVAAEPRGYAVTGPLSKPAVTPVPSLETEAALRR